MLFCNLLAILPVVLLMPYKAVQSQHSLRGTMRKANKDKKKVRVLNSSTIESQPYYYHGQPKYDTSRSYDYEPDLSLETPDIISSSTYDSMLEEIYSPSSLSSQTPSDMSRFSSKETEQDSSFIDYSQDLHNMGNDNVDGSIDPIDISVFKKVQDDDGNNDDSSDDQNIDTDDNANDDDAVSDDDNVQDDDGNNDDETSDDQNIDTDDNANDDDAVSDDDNVQDDDGNDDDSSDDQNIDTDDNANDDDAVSDDE